MTSDSSISVLVFSLPNTMIFQLLMTIGLSTLVLSVPTLRQNIPQIVSHCTQSKTAALTFDDGPYNNAKYIVDTLDNAGAKGTFFYNGNNWDCIYNQVDNIRYVYEHGHQIGSHTWSHSHLLSLNRKQVISELQKVDDALLRILGVLPAFWRPPYGEYNQTILDIASGQFERTAVLWDLDSGDSTGSTVAQSKIIYDKAVQSNKPNYISLEHETYSTTAHQVLPYAISVLQKAGYRLVTVAECLGGLDPYRKVSEPQKPDSNWHC